MDYSTLNVLVPSACDSETWERFRSKISVSETGCWVWTASFDKDGYGMFRYKRRTWRSHRFCFVIVAGNVPHRAHLHHICENKLCVNPAHLQDVTRTEHVALTPHHPAYKNGHATHCIHGHEFTLENTYLYDMGTYKMRSCRACNRVNVQKYHVRKKAQETK